MLVTTDATSMYTNIDTTHALCTIKSYVREHRQHATSAERIAVIDALEITMRNNIVQFGDTFWLQTDGTAMGVSPSCVYATLYFAAFEESLRQRYPEIHFYRRYIDDVFIIWVPLGTEIHDSNRYRSFQQEFNSFGKLKWEFSDRSTVTNFLDLTITITTNGFLKTKLYEKPENLYLYLPANSSHPFANLKGLVHGMVYRTIRLTSDFADQQRELQNLFNRLHARGYPKSLIRGIIIKSYTKIQGQDAYNIPNDMDTGDNVCFLHASYHPRDPKSFELQKIFQSEVVSPRGCIRQLHELKNHKNHPIGINRMIVAYHRTHNLGNLLSPRIMKETDGPLVSSYIT
jgi:hypothetical protein